MQIDLHEGRETVRVASKAVLIIAVAATLAGVAACGGSPTTTKQQAATTGGEVRGTVTMWYLEDLRPEFLKAVKKGFEAKYPSTTLDMTEVPEDGYVTKVDTALLAHQPPDVGFIYEPRWMKGGSVLQLGDMIKQNHIDTSNMNQVALSECELDGQLYCLGSLTGSVVLLYNKDLFDKAKLPYPSSDQPMSIDEYGELSRKLASALPGVQGSVAGAPFTWSARTTHFSADGRKIAGVVDDDATIHMYEVLGALARDKVSPKPAESDLVPPSDRLGAGDVAMAITDMEVAANSLEKAGYRWGAAPPPVEQKGDPSFVFVGTDKYGVFKDGPNPTGGAALVAYIATEGNKLRAQVTDQPPLDATMLDEWAGKNGGRKEVVKVLSTSKEPGLFVPGFWEVTAAFGDLYAQFASGEAQPRPAIEKAAPAAQDKLDREWRTWENIR
jgi:multiple sugar transport system substrate-binding protein